MNCGDNSIIPVMARNMSANQKCSGGFKKMSILSFSNTILLWCLRTSRLMDNSMLLEVSLKVMIDKFSTIVGAKNLDLSIKLSFHLFVEGLKTGKHFVFILQQIKPCHPCTIIDECDKPSNTRRSSDRRRSPDIRVN